LDWGWLVKASNIEGWLLYGSFCHACEVDLREEKGACELRKMHCDPSKDYFAVLGLSSQADPEVVKAAHRALAKKFHPDRHPDDDGEPKQKFHEIQEAYEVLRDDDRLKQYLRLRAQVQMQEQMQKTKAAGPHMRPRVYLKLDDRWEHLVRKYPELSQHYAKFCFMSHMLGNQFKLIILGTQDHTRFKRVAAKLERQFYRKHFSYHRNLQKLARRLAENHRRHAVRMLQGEIKGRRFLSKRRRCEIVWRYESRYLQTATASDADRPQRSGRARATARRFHPGQQRTTLRPSRSRPIAWVCMGMVVALGTLSVFGPLFDPSGLGIGQQAQVQGLGLGQQVQVQGLTRANCILTARWSTSGGQLNKNVC